MNPTPPPNPIEPQSAAMSQRIRLRKFDLLLSQSSPTPLISVGVAVLLVLLLWPVQDHGVLVLWLVFIGLSGVLRVSLLSWFAGSVNPMVDLSHWMRFYRATVAAYFLVWGLGGVWIMPPDSPMHQFVVLYFLMGLAGSAISVLSADRVSLMIAICALLLPSLIWFTTIGGVLHSVSAVAGFVYLLSASRSSGVFDDTITENLELAERLAFEKERAEQMTEQIAEALDKAYKADDAKAKFFAAANHDLRQPMQAIYIMSDVLSKKLRGTESAEIVQSIQRAVDTLSDQLNGFLEVSNLDAGATPARKDYFFLDQLVAALEYEYRPLAAKQNIRMKVKCPDNAQVYTDRILLERIIRNLIANVLAHTRDCDLTLHVDEEGQQHRIEVADNGPGIPLDAQELIFEEFYQIPNGDKENHGGLGLGLSIVRRLDQLLGLKMHMTSAEGDGTMFCMYVPKYPV